MEEFVKDLLVSPEEAKNDIQQCIDSLASGSVDNSFLLKWYDETCKVLDHVFVKGGSNYFYVSSGFEVSSNYYSNGRHLRDMNIPRAAGILRRLIKLIDEKHSSGINNNLEKSPGLLLEPINNKVFVVHGHDESLREKVERLIEKIGLEPVVLNKKANEGKTILEKIEAHSGVDFAVVLFTPDDIGGAAKLQKHDETRPRQNVLLELGYFWGKIGRNRVCLLNAIGSNISSDLSGLGYVSVDERGAWRIELIRELRRAGYSVDANEILDL